MRKRKHQNGCFLRALSLLVGGGFLLLGLCFGMYVCVVRPPLGFENSMPVNQLKTLISQQINPVQVEPTTHEALGKGVSNKKAEREQQKLEQKEKINQEVSKLTTQTPKTEKVISIQEQEVKKPIEAVETLVEDTVPMSESVVAEIKPTDIDLYERYTLTLDQEALEEVGYFIEAGQINYKKLMDQAMNTLTFSEKMDLVNMILSKVQQVDVPRLWNMIQDGVTEEEGKELEKLIYEHFSEEEMEQLYQYYEKIEIASNNE